MTGGRGSTGASVARVGAPGGPDRPYARRGALGPLVFAAVFVSFAALPSFASSYTVGVATTLAMWVALSESWIILSGLAGYISLGHAAFVGVGAYVMSLGWGKAPIWLLLAAAGASAGALALLAGAPCLRVRGPYFVILTLGVSEFCKFIVVNVEAGLGNFGRLLLGAPGIEGIYYSMLSVAAVAYIVAVCVRRSRFGTGLRAIREDEGAAGAMGVPIVRFKIAAFMLSAFIPGIVGALLVMRSGYFEPLQMFDPRVSLTIVTMAVIGGADDPPGPLFGTLFLVMLSELLWANWPQLYMILLGLLLIGFIVLAPDGIYGRLRAGRRLRRA
jgi:branched-chain amino acid transport system permease protein